MQLDLGYINAINEDDAFSCFEESKEGKRKRRFASTGPAYNADALIALDTEREAFQDWWQICRIATNKTGDFKTSFRRPSCRRRIALLTLDSDVRILHNALCCIHIQFDVGVLSESPNKSYGVLQREAQSEASQRRIDAS